MAAQGKLAHSVLLQGDDGLDDFAIALALYLLCRAPNDNLACGKCKDCELFAAGSHPDFHYTGLEEKASQIKVDQIRLLIDFVTKTAQREKRKVVVLNPASAMNINAANALLKCLEEPSGDTVLILLQESQKMLLPTIRSRCSVLKLPQPSKNSAVAWLEAKGVASPEDALKYAQNSPLLAWRLSSEGQLSLWQKIYQSLDKHIQRGMNPMQLVLAWKGVALSELIQIVLSWLEDKIRSAFAAGVERQVVVKLYTCRDSLAKKKQRLHLGFNLNEQLVLEEVAIELQACADLSPKSL